MKAKPPCPPSNRLYNLIKAACKQDPSLLATNGTDENNKSVDDVVMGGGKRLLAEYEGENQSGSKQKSRNVMIQNI